MDRHRLGRAGAVAVAALGAGAMLAACGSSGGSLSSGGSSGTPSITVGYFDVPTDAAITYAEQNGYFSKVGLKVDLKSLQPTEFVPAATSGQVDISMGATQTLLLGAGQGLPIRVLFNSVTETQQNCPQVVQVLKSSSITSLMQLKGKTVAVASTDSAQDLSLDPILAHDGVGISNVKYLPTGANGPSELEALDKGTAQAMVQTEPFSNEELAKGAKNISNLCVPPTPNNYGLVAYFTTSSFLSSHRPDVKLFEDGMAQAASYIDSHNQAYDQYLAKQFKVPAATLASEQPGIVSVSDSTSTLTYTKQAEVAAGLKVSSVDLHTLRTPLLTSSGGGD